MINTAAALWTPLFSVFVINHIMGATLATIGITGAIYSIMKSSLQIPIAKYLDASVGEKSDFIIISSGVFLAGISSFSLIFIDRIWELVCIQIVWGIADACTMAAYYSIFSHHIDKKSAAFEWSLFSVGGMTVAIALGGLAGGFATQAYGFPVVFLAAGTLNMIAFLMLITFYPRIRTIARI
jgi:predicted MFS family arabinose efflux permease